MLVRYCGVVALSALHLRRLLVFLRKPQHAGCSIDQIYRASDGARRMVTLTVTPSLILISRSQQLDTLVAIVLIVTSHCTTT
jgi:hypothetical protein